MFRRVGSQAGGRLTLPVILKDKSAVVLYRWEDEVYCSDANSTAFKFPLVDAKLLERALPPFSSLCWALLPASYCVICGTKATLWGQHKRSGVTGGEMSCMVCSYLHCA